MTRTAQHPLLAAADLLVHCFARAEWQQIDGGKWRSSGGRVLSNDAYQRHKGRLTDRAARPGGAKQGAAPKAGAASAPAPGSKPGTVKNVYGQDVPDIKPGEFRLPGESGAKPKPAAKPKPSVTLGGQLPGYENKPNLLARPKPAAPVRAPALPGGAKLPDPSPADSAYITAQHGKDTRLFGPKVADFLKRATAGVVGILTGMNGLAWGALAGSALGGPLGLALGTAVGGGLGGRLGAWAGKKVLTASGGKGRLTAMARQGVRKVLPGVAGAAVGGPVAAAAALPAALGIPSMATSGMIGVDAALGFPATRGLMDVAAAGVKAPGAVARGVRGGLATSRASARKAAGVKTDAGLDGGTLSDLRSKEAERFWAARRKRNGFAEPNAAASLDPVALIKARVRAMLARQGKPADIVIDDEPILAALALAAGEADAQERGAAVQTMGEPVRRLLATSRRLRRA